MENTNRKNTRSAALKNGGATEGITGNQTIGTKTHFKIRVLKHKMGNETGTVTVIHP